MSVLLSAKHVGLTLTLTLPLLETQATTSLPLFCHLQNLDMAKSKSLVRLNFDQPFKLSLKN